MKLTDDEKLKLYEEIVRCRKALAESRILQRPPQEGSTGFIRNTLRRYNHVKYTWLLFPCLKYKILVRERFEEHFDFNYHSVSCGKAVIR